jgi:hypothetical protein
MTPIQIQQLVQQLTGLMVQLMLLSLLAFGLKTIFGSVLRGSVVGLPKGEEMEMVKWEMAMMPHVERMSALGEGKMAAPYQPPPGEKLEIRYFPDSCEQCEESMERTGMKHEIRKAFEEAKARARSKSK